MRECILLLFSHVRPHIQQNLNYMNIQLSGMDFCMHKYVITHACVILNCFKSSCAYVYTFIDSIPASCQFLESVWSV